MARAMSRKNMQWILPKMIMKMRGRVEECGRERTAISGGGC